MTREEPLDGPLQHLWRLLGRSHYNSYLGHHIHVGISPRAPHNSPFLLALDLVLNVTLAVANGSRRTSSLCCCCCGEYCSALQVVAMSVGIPRTRR